MSPELTAKLFATYPDMFSRITPEQIQCENGWYVLIDTLCKQVQAHCDEEPREPFFVRQIKEKFAGLRFYRTGGDDWIGGLISMAEAISLHTCEICGNAGSLNTGRPMQIRCKNHTESV